MHLRFTLAVDGMQKRTASFAIPEMSLSSARSMMKKRNFEICFDAAELTRGLESAYASLVKDLRQDDLECGAAQDGLASAGYPSLNQVLLSPSLLRLVIGNYLFAELIAAQGPIDGVLPRFWSDEVISCSLDGAAVSIKGICYSND